MLHHFIIFKALVECNFHMAFNFLGYSVFIMLGNHCPFIVFSPSYIERCCIIFVLNKKFTIKKWNVGRWISYTLKSTVFSSISVHANDLESKPYKCYLVVFVWFLRKLNSNWKTEFAILFTLTCILIYFKDMN